MPGSRAIVGRPVACALQVVILETLHCAEVKHALRVRSFREMQSFRAEVARASRMCRRGGHASRLPGGDSRR